MRRPLLPPLHCDGHFVRRQFYAIPPDVVLLFPGVEVTGEVRSQDDSLNATELAHRDREFRVHNAIHRGCKKRNRKLFSVDLPGDINLAGIERYQARNQRNFIKAVLSLLILRLKKNLLRHPMCILSENSFKIGMIKI